jgi:PIN domain nuclease of toxin-antitoxin system
MPRYRLGDGKVAWKLPSVRTSRTRLTTPFDRLIMAQASVEGLTVVGRDESFDNCGVQRIW